MKTLLALFLLTLTSMNAEAAQPNFQCTTQAPDPWNLGETYSLTFQNGTYKVFHYGHSRNTYSAQYSGHETVLPRFVGIRVALEKTIDHSTWSDMPEKLYLDKYESGMLLVGLTPKPLYFAADTCHELSVDSEINLSSTEASGCFPGLQQECNGKCISARADCN